MTRTVNYSVSSLVFQLFWNIIVNSFALKKFKYLKVPQKDDHSLNLDCLIKQNLLRELCE